MAAGGKVPGAEYVGQEQDGLIDEAFRVHGKVVHNASLADAYMYELFHHYAGTTRAIAQAIFFTLDSAKARHVLTMRTARAANADDPAIKAIDKLALAIGKVTEGRNKIAHAFLLQDDPIFSEAEIRLLNPKTPFSGSRRAKSAGRLLPEGPELQSRTISQTSLQKALQTSDDHLLAATAAFREICRNLGIKPRVTLALF